VDTAYSTKSFADYTVILTSLIFAGKFYVIDMARGRYNEFELPAVIAGVGFKWKPKRIAIEDSVGVRWFSRELRREMDKLSISIPVEYVSLGAGNKTKSKEVKAKPVLRLLGDERLYFSNSCAGMEDIYNELSKFPNGTHDDIVSGLSILVDQFAAYADMDAKINFVSSQYVADRQAQEMHDMVYGLGKYSKYNINYALEDNPVTVFHMENSPEVLSDVDPFKDLF
jgi:phage terminase large subunit-like protein